MAAFRRRTQFAAPLIITVAACSSSKEKPKPEQKSFPGVTWQVVMDNMKCRAVSAQVSGDKVATTEDPPPREIQCPPGMTGGMYMTVGELAPDKCAVVPQGCVDASCAKPTTPCPLPFGKQLVQKLAYVWTIEKRGEKCHAEEEDHDCPPGVDCNPPAPRTFDCPPGVTEDKDLHIAELPDATCVIVPDGCLDTGCATEKIPCPPMK